MKKLLLSLILLTLGAGAALGQAPVVDTGWSVFVIREGATEAPFIVDNDDYVIDAIEVGTTESGQKVGLATDLINGARIDQINALHIDRLDDVASSGSLYGPYFNIWVTNGLGQYAVLANEPSDAEWAADRWDVPDWATLSTRRCKVYEVTGSSGGTPGTSWVAAHATGNGWDGVSDLRFADVADLIISPPSAAYIQDGANGVGSGAPDELGTDIAHGYTWVFGDTAANYVTGGDGFIVDGYYVSSSVDVHNVTQDLYYATIEAALSAAAPYDVIEINDGYYFPPSTLNVSIPLTLRGESEDGVRVQIPAAGGYGMNVAASDVTLEHFTLLADAANINYPIHASGTSNPPLGFDNLTLQYMTISGAHRRTCFDIHGFNNVVLSHLTASDSWGGNGLQVTGVAGAAIDNITTLDNAWGSLAIYCSDLPYLGRGSSDVTIDGASCSFGEGVVFTQDEFGLFNTNTVVTSYGYNVRNFNFRPDAAGYVYYQDTEAHAITQALTLDGIAPGSWITAIGGGSHIVAEGMGIQFAIDGAAAGDLISVRTGHFEEQLLVTTPNLTISGAGSGSTFIDSPATLANSFTTSADNHAVVGVVGVGGVNFADLTVDGLGRGNANSRFLGFGFYNAGGSLTNVQILNIMDTPFSGAQHGVGAYVYTDNGGPHQMDMTDVQVLDFQKTAVALAGAGLTGDLLRVDTFGQGPTDVTAQNGIQVGYEAVVNVNDCTATGMAYTGGSWSASGMLAVGDGLAYFDGCTLDGCQTSIYFSDGGGSFNNGSVINPVGDALYAYSGGAKAGDGDTPLPAQPYDSNGSQAGKAPIVVSIDGSTFTGTGATDSWGPTAYGSGPVTFSITNSTVTNWDWGVVYYDFGGLVLNASGTGNEIFGNTTYGAYSNAVEVADMIGNWWGHASGPLHLLANPFGEGNEVSDNILFDPWTGMAGGDIVPVTTGPLNCGQTVTLTFSFTADDYTPDMFLYNAVVSATPGLDFGLVEDLEPFGDVNNTFFALSTGTNQWTITGSTVGNPTFPVTGAGTTDLFRITFSATGNVVGDVVFDSLTLRDPDNNTIPVALTGATITYDCTPPDAVTDISAEPGHNKVNVSWTHDGSDVAYYRIYRGLWHDGTVGTSAYPEYDDQAPATPSVRPVSPAAANLDPEWVLAGTVAVGSNTYTDNFSYGPNSRGIYTYEVFAEDAAGNVSAAAPTNDRATNYWLGDVYGDSSVDPVPNGEVDPFDMNELAASFGTVIGHNDPEGVLDVGPTDDMSRLGIPTTDSIVNFEDLMVFAMNFGVVAAAKADAPQDKSIDLAWVDLQDGSYALRLVSGDALKGLRLRGDLPVTAVTAGDLLAEQPSATFLQNVGEKLDANLAVMGLNRTFAGEGDLLIVRTGAPVDPASLTIVARGVDNREIQYALDRTSGTALPSVFALHGNYPNPFNPKTTIRFDLPEAQTVRMTVYGVDGRKIATLLDEVRGRGAHDVVWYGRDDAGKSVASGTYFFRIEAGPYSQVRKMTLMK